ncbi:hypothetical protein NEAUS03_0215 [Nematocida ausubeli]|nr:hypothetical protein NEAUS03_0215 [Nematocida ausubeli]
MISREEARGGKDKRKKRADAEKLREANDRNSIKENILFKFDNYTRKTDKNIALLHNITFEVPKKRLIALIGMSGEGKSTLFESISGQCNRSHKTFGTVLVQTKEGIFVERNAEEWVKRVNYHRQEVTQYKKIPVYALLQSVAKCYGKDIEMVDKLLVHFRIAKTKHTMFAMLSGGEQKRVMTIIGIISERELNLWDEPLTGLDSEIAKKTLRFMKESETTNIVSIHQPSDELMNMFDWVIFMHASTVIYAGPYIQMETYFRERRIVNREDTMIINYLMRLSADNPDNQTDVNNIESLNSITKEIIKRPRGVRRSGNVFISNSFGFSYTRVKEILSRSLYFDNGFKGSSLVYEMIYYLFSIFLFIMGAMVVDRLILSQNEGFLKRSIFDPIYGLLDILNIMKERGSLPEYYMEILQECISTSASVKWLFGAVSFFQTERSIMFISMASLFSNITNLDYLRLCQINIAEGQFSVLEFIFAHIIEIVFRKVSIAFVICVIYYSIAYKTIVGEDIQHIITPNYSDIGLVSMVTSVIMGIYILSIQCLPISSKLHIYVAFGLLLLTQTIIRQLDSLEIFVDTNTASLLNGLLKGNISLENMKIPEPPEHHPFYDTKIYMIQKNQFLDKLAETMDTENTENIKYHVLTVLSNALKTLYKMGPFGVPEEILTKLRIYREEIYSVQNANKLSLRIAGDLQQMENDLPKKDYMDYIYKTKYIERMSRPFSIHEMFEPTKEIETVGKQDIAKSITRVFLLPMLFLTFALFLRYRQLQPKIRS